MNAPDLIADYYRRDLSEAEDDALAAELQASPEAAERFAALAASDYKRFGLPEPGESQEKRRGRKALWALLAIVASVALLNQMLSDERAKVVSVPEAGEALRQVSRPEAPVAEETGPEQAVQAAAAPVPVPVRLRVSAESANGPFHVKVEGADAQPLGVFDPAGRPIGRLRATGPRDLSWDGLDASGLAVLPGRYALSVRAGGRELKQWVEIDVR